MDSKKPKSGTIYTTAATYPLFRRLELLVRKLIGRRFKSANDIWQLQVDTLNLQREIQERIGVVKKKAKRDADARQELEALRHLRHQARRFGDALAWVILGNERQLIFPLARNQRTSINAEDHGSRGMLAIAQALGNDGWGFPLLHDVTDCLRIGDITFVQASSETGQDGATYRDRQIKTVEVKTSLVEETLTDAGNTMYSYRVTVLSAFDIYPRDEMPSSVADSNDTVVEQPKVPPPRIGRQLQRMGAAKAYQEAAADTFNKFGDESFINAVAISDHPSYWSTVRRVARNARKFGYASEPVESSFLYVAFYGPNGVDLDIINEPKFLADVKSCGILFEEGHGENAIVLNGIPTAESTAPELYLPYFLYSLPQWAIIDLIYGRLLIFILTNRGRIAEVLEREGFQVSVSSKGPDPYGSFVVSGRVTDGSGIEYRVELHKLHQHMIEMIYEFKGTQYLIDVASKMLDTALLGVKAHNDGIGATALQTRLAK